MHLPTEIIDQYELWWEGKNTEPVIYYTWWKEPEAVWKFRKPWMLELPDPGWVLAQAVELTAQSDDWRYVDEALDLVAARLEEGQSLGAGFPNFFFNFGAGSAAAIITGFSKFYLNTVWFELDEPLPYENITTLSPDTRSRYADYMVEALRWTVKRLEGLAVVSQADLGGTMDILASLRRTNELLYDMADQAPEVIHAALRRIEGVWGKAYTEYDNIAAPVNGGLRSSWMPILSRKRYYPLQCDFGAMISPVMFREYVQPSLERQCAFLDRAVFHLDGQEMICHLESICAVEGIKAIQYTPGDGHTGCHDEQWYPLYERIINMGKKIVLLGFAAEEEQVRKLFRRFPREVFYLLIHGRDRETGEKLLRNY